MGSNNGNSALANVDVLRIRSVDELRAARKTWDELWRRSNTTTPIARATLLADWIEQFAPKDNFEAIIVREGGQWRAALPLVSCRFRLLDAMKTCGSTWTAGGPILVDSHAEINRIMDAMVRAVGQLPVSLLCLSDILIEARKWRAFRDAAARAGMPCDVQIERQTGVVEITHDWNAYEASWTKKHRQKMRHCLRLADEAGVAFRRQTHFAADEVESAILQALDVESRSWKGNVGTSVMRRGESAYLIRQARQLAEWGQLELAFLETPEKVVAFAYGFVAKGVHHICKIGYDPDFASITPGQVLFHHLFRQLHDDPDARALDFYGNLTPSLAVWRPSPLPVGRLLVAPRRWIGRVAIYVNRLRRRTTPKPSVGVAAM